MISHSDDEKRQKGRRNNQKLTNISKGNFIWQYAELDHNY